MTSMKAIRDVAGIKSANTRLRAEIRRLAADELQVVWGFPNGARITLESYILRAPTYDIYVGLGETRENYSSHVFRIVRHGEAPTPAFHPNVEVNVSKVGSARGAGVYVSNSGQLWLCHRGRINAFRGPIETETALAYFAQFLVPVLDGDRWRDIIPVAALGSNTFVADLEAFIVRVIELKQQYKSGYGGLDAVDDDEKEKEDDTWPWNDGKEFEGSKTIAGRDGGAYEYRHGPLCNRLSDTLKAWTASPYGVRRTMNIDSAVVGEDGVARAIFEVKTSASLSDQVYKAVGQLLYYRRKRGNAETLLALVLPGEGKACADSTVVFMRELGFHVFFEQGPGHFCTAEGVAMESVLSNEIPHK